MAQPVWRIDPRWYQIAVLSSLLVYGTAALHFEITAIRALLILAAVLCAQFACTRVWKLPAFDPKSALISGLSLCLLLRTNSARLALIACGIAIVSKFVLRVRGKHLFNPTNFGLVAMMAATGLVWVSPGQWGSGAFFGFLIACLGGLVVNRAARSDISIAFLLCWIGLIVGRSLWLGEPLMIPLHRLQNGALLIFTFFMISDPKTTPDSRSGRVLFAASVAVAAYYIQFRLFRTNGLLWALAACSPLVPIIDRVLPGARYNWNWRVQRPAAATPLRAMIPVVPSSASGGQP